MALELNKVTGQVDAMGQALAGRRGELAERASRASDLLAAQPEVSEELRRKIKAARALDEWRRGAIPLGDRLDDRHALDRAAGHLYPDRHGRQPDLPRSA